MLPERERIQEWLDVVESNGGSPDSFGEWSVLKAYAEGQLVVPVKPDYEAIAKAVYAVTSGNQHWTQLTDQQQAALISVCRMYVDAALEGDT